MSRRATSAESARYLSPAIAWWALALLLLCYFMYFVDRNILTLLVAPVRKELGINDTEMGILQGYSFSVLNGIMAIPFAWIADRWSRRNVLIFGVALWGLSTICSGLTTTYTELLFTRMGLGIGEAALMPAAFSLLSDYFPRERHGLAVGIFGVGGFGGIGLSYLIGGAVLAAFRGVNEVTLPLVGTTSLWHAAFITVGCTTVILAIILATIIEPPRINSRKEPEPGAESFFGHLKQHWLAFVLVIGGYICLSILAIGWFAWLPSYFIRVFKMMPQNVGLEVGWVTTIAGVTGALAGGTIADWMARRGTRGGKLPTLAVMFVIWIPCALGIYVSDNPNLSLVFVFLFTFADGIGFMQYGNVMQEMFPNHLRARSIAAWAVCSSMFSYGIGPLMFGFSNDFIFHGDDGLRSALGLISLPVIAVGFACAWFGRRPYDRARHAVDPAAKVDLSWIEDDGLPAPATR